MEFAGLYQDSAHTKEHLQSLHRNIKVLRHPRTFVSLWSHHEKLCIIDQTSAFIGGLDICLGRWDTQEHPISDPGMDGKYLFPGKDYENSYTKPFTKVKEWATDFLDRKSQPRMPWHDLHLFIHGDSAVDLARHFIEYWNHAKFDKEHSKKSYDRKDFLKPTKTIRNLGTKKKKDSSGDDNGYEDNFFSDSDDSAETQSPAKLVPVDSIRNQIYRVR